MQRIEEHLDSTDLNPATALNAAYNRAEYVVDFVKLAREKDATGFAKLMAEQCDLDKADAQQIIDDKKGFAFAVCLKSLALPSYVANEAFILLNPKLGTDVEQVFLLDWFYGLISPATARSLTKTWSKDKTNRSYQSVYALSLIHI